MIPGLQKEFFQDDLYPDTSVCWEPALTASAWLSGSNGQHKKMSLKPKGMTPGKDTGVLIMWQRYRANWEILGGFCVFSTYFSE